MSGGSLEDAYAFYRRPEFVVHGGPEMIKFLDSVADILKAKVLYFGTSHLRLSLSRVENGRSPKSSPRYSFSRTVSTSTLVVLRILASRRDIPHS